jgi:hypothetical protein
MTNITTTILNLLTMLTIAKIFGYEKLNFSISVVIDQGDYHILFNSMFIFVSQHTHRNQYLEIVYNI